MLPRLTDDGPIAETLQCGVGKFANPCESCSLRDVCVKNCCRTDCTQRVCHRDCNNCGGSGRPGDQAYVPAPAVCSKAPLRDVFLDMVRRDAYDFGKQPLIKLKNKGVMVVNGSAGQIKQWYPDDVEAIGINFRHAWSPGGRGWRSQDMRDYLHIPSKKTKLILLTATFDDDLERAWDHNFFDENYKEVGFDYWQALEFSIYDNMSNFNNLWTSYRNLYVQAACKAHFSHLPPYGLRLDRGSSATWRDAAKAAPNVLVNFQMGRLARKEDVACFTRMVSRIRKWHETVGSPMTAWLNGAGSANIIYNFKRNLPGVDCYFLTMAPWLFANRGSELTERGTAQRSKLPRSELLLLNQQRYANLVAHTLKCVERDAKADQGDKHADDT